MANSIQIAILDDQILSRNGLRMLVEQAGIPSDQVVDFADLKTLIEHLNTVCTRILLVSDQLPTGQDIVQVVKMINQNYPALSVLVIGHRLNTAYISRLLTNGMQGYIYDKSKLDEIIPIALKRMLQGEIYLSPKVAVLPYHRQKMGELEERDIEVLVLLAKGQSISEIAHTLSLTRRVIYSIRSRLKQYLQVNNNEQIIVAALEQGLLVE